MRTAYRCRAYPSEQQQVLLNRTFGCVRVVWNRTLAARQTRYAAERRSTSYAATDRALTVLKRDPELAWLNEVSSVPLQQALRHQHAAFGAFFARRARYPRFNRAKARVRVARAHARVADARRDFLHQVSISLIRSYDTIAVEDLAVKNMVRNRKLARAISRTGWGEFRRQLEYKADRYGGTVVVVDRWFPSSKTCSACRFLLAELDLGTRQWACPACGTRHDRDINAASNILAAGLAAAIGNGGDACGADVRHGQATPPVQTAMNQEPRRATTGIPALGEE